MTTEDGSNEENLKILREKAGQVDSLKQQVQQLSQQLAIRDSKINTGHPAFELFQKGYDGEWTSDALNEAGERYGLLTEEAPAAQPQPQQTQQQQAPPGGMEFSDEQLSWLKTNIPALGNVQTQQQQAGPQSAGDLFSQQAEAQRRMDAAQQGGQTQNPGQLSTDDWKKAGSKEEFLARYSQAGGTVTSEN